VAAGLPTRATINSVTLTLCLLCAGCTVLSHDVYFSPSSSSPHELRSPFRGSPFDQFTMFGAPADIISVEPVDGLRFGLAVRNYGYTSAWMGPVFVPVFPVHLFFKQPLDSSPLSLWFAIATERELEFSLQGVFIRTADGRDDIRPRDARPHAVTERLRIVAGGSLAATLEFDAPLAEEFDGPRGCGLWL
jgi:hypothetical protein